MTPIDAATQTAPQSGPIVLAVEAANQATPNVKEDVKVTSIGNEVYLWLLSYMDRLHVEKAAGYSGGDQPDNWSNFREAEGWGSTPLTGSLIRLGDKYRRAQNVFRDITNDRVGEPLARTLVDLAAYSLISVCLWAEENHINMADLEKVLRGGEA